LAAQLYALRKQRDWSQQQLAERSGIAQERISKIESADFNSITLSTLNKLARAFDVDVRVAFESFSQGILDVVNLNPKALEIQSRQASLKSFSNQLLKISHEGKWLLAPNNVVQMKPTSLSAVPVALGGEWTRLASHG
jgi:transcriptional regulator with XRE-family HTH domain